MKKETYYFSHDSNALTDTKILNMRADYGLEGYGLYWVIIEMMRNEEDYKLEFSKNTFRAIKTLTNTTIDIEKYIKDCIEDYKLFQQQEKNFYSESLLKRMQIKDDKSATARERAQKRWNNNATDMQKQCTSNATDMQKQCTSNANKEKERKEKERKENVITITTGDSCVDGLEKIIEFYNNNIGLITPHGMDILKDYSAEMSKDLIILAMKKSVEANKRTIQYIKGILNNWSKKGIKTVLEAEKEDEDFRKKDKKEPNKETFEQRQYSSEQFESLYAN